MASLAPVIDPDVRAHATSGRVRVLVRLRLTPAEEASTQAIEHAQDAVLARVPAVLVRRFQSVPLLALEIDRSGLMALESLGDLVSRVDLDQPVRTQ